VARRERRKRRERKKKARRKRRRGKECPHDEREVSPSVSSTLSLRKSVCGDDGS
jgi:hypothetical protein